MLQNVYDSNAFFPVTGCPNRSPTHNWFFGKYHVEFAGHFLFSHRPNDIFIIAIIIQDM